MSSVVDSLRQRIKGALARRQRPAYSKSISCDSYLKPLTDLKLDFLGSVLVSWTYLATGMKSDVKSLA